jgi:hypothetical protein
VAAHPGRAVGQRLRVRHRPVRRLSRAPQQRTRAAVPAKRRSRRAVLSGVCAAARVAQRSLARTGVDWRTSWWGAGGN